MPGPLWLPCAAQPAEHKNEELAPHRTVPNLPKTPSLFLWCQTGSQMGWVQLADSPTGTVIPADLR